MDDSAPGNDDHAMPIEGRKISPAAGWSFSPNSVPIRGGGTNNAVNTSSNVSCGRTFCLETACGSQADFEAAVGAQDEHQRNKTHFDWPEVGSLQKTDLREFDPAFSIGSNYPDDPRWSPDVEHGYFHKPNLSTDPEGSAANPILIEPRVSDPVSSHQQPSMNNEASLDCEALTSYSCSEHFSSRKKSRGVNPDRVLDKMANNPLEMYFPPLTAATTTTYERPPPATQMLPPEGCFSGDGALDSSDGSSAGSCERPRWSSVLEALPVQFLAFQKLQEGMDELDTGTRMCISDALYRLASSVEERHRVHQQLTTGGSSVGSSAVANRRGTTQTQELHLQKPLNRKTASRRRPDKP